MDSRGTSFITAFPENIAFYFQKTYNLLKITTLHPNTAVSVIEMESGNITNSGDVNNGTILTLNFSKDAEEYQFAFSNKSFRITSDKNITVLSISGWEGRFNSRVVPPDQNLGTVYQIPALNYTKIAASFNLSVTSNVTFLNFRLMIINAVDGDNRVTIKYGDGSGQGQETITLGPFDLFQMQINGSVGEISATDKVAVILTHPCLDTVNCSCNMVANQLKPQVSDRKVASFPVPSIFGVKQLFVTTNQAFKVCQGVFNNANSIAVQTSADILPLFPNFVNKTLLISTSIHVSLRLISPGLILDLMPTSMFSGCFLVDFNSLHSGALVIANTSSTTGVKMNDQPLNVIWYPLNGTEYSWALVEAQVIGTIWHPNTKIGVYMTERLDSNTVYGSQAIALNMDLGKCLNNCNIEL